MKMNRNSPFGKISPAMMEGEMDRPAHYEQDGKLFDAHDRWIEPGKPLVVAKTAAPRVDVAAAVEAIPASRLLEQADTMAWSKFRLQAKKILGETCPGDKEGIKAALAAGIAFVQAREEKRAPPAQADQAGLSWDSITGGNEASAAAVAPGGVDLKAWATGQREYLFGEVQKAIRKTYNKQITERVDAVTFLIEQGIVTADQARRDV